MSGSHRLSASRCPKVECPSTPAFPYRDGVTLKSGLPAEDVLPRLPVGDVALIRRAPPDRQNVDLSGSIVRPTEAPFVSAVVNGPVRIGIELAYIERETYGADRVQRAVEPVMDPGPEDEVEDYETHADDPSVPPGQAEPRRPQRYAVAHVTRIINRTQSHAHRAVEVPDPAPPSRAGSSPPRGHRAPCP